jgi:hypothetical protein
MSGRMTIRSSDDHVATLRKLHWSLVPEFLILDGKAPENRLRNYSLLLSEAELGHLEKLCAVKVRALKPKKLKAPARKISKGNGGPGKKTEQISAKKAAQMGRLF